ncbi:uncharacterized protein LOC142339266 isoform X3 [Convolutriloba macropyga]|uniref:uncharacterized protein LOC142339266 isoform X3 n=1 Tax=Convolutriloba macropyga TaxID=536237 RepID=UPI003F521E6D
MTSMEKLMRRIEEQKQGKAATQADIQELLKRDISWDEINGSKHPEAQSSQPKVRKVTQGPAAPNYLGFSKVEEIGHLHHELHTKRHNGVETIDQHGHEYPPTATSKSIMKRKPSKQQQTQVVRKVAAFNEEAHQKNPSILNTNVWKSTKAVSVKSNANSNGKVRLPDDSVPTAMASSVPVKTPSAKTHASTMPLSNQAEEPLSSSRHPPMSKTAREILSEIQDEQRVVSKQLLESNIGVKRRAKDPSDVSSVQQPQEQIVSKAKTYDTDSIRQYMAKKRHLEKLKDKQNQEDEKKRREEKEKRLKELERKRKEAASRAVKRPFNPELGSALDMPGSDRILGMEFAGDDEQDGTDEIDGFSERPTSKIDSVMSSIRGAPKINNGVNLNNSLDSSDKENKKHTGPVRKERSDMHSRNNASLDSVKSGPRIKFDVTDLLESSDYTLDEESISTGVRRQRDSISTSEVNEQLKRSKALLAELNMKRMGIPSSQKPVTNTTSKPDDTEGSRNATGCFEQDVRNNETQRDPNIQRGAASGDDKSGNFNDRLMKLSKTANDLRSRLSDETKNLADRINPTPIEEAAVYESRQHAVESRVDIGNLDTSQDHEEFRFPASGVGWSEAPQSNEKRQSEVDARRNEFGEPIRYQSMSGSKRKRPPVVSNDNRKQQVDASHSKPIKWKLPEPKLHMVTMPTPQATDSSQPGLALGEAASNADSARVTTRTVMQHISKTGGPSFTLSHATDSYQQPPLVPANTNQQSQGQLNDRKEEFDSYLKRIIREAELNSPESIFSPNQMRTLDSRTGHSGSRGGADGSNQFNESFMPSREGGGDPFSVINIYTRQMAKEYSERIKKLQHPAPHAGPNSRQRTSIEAELDSTDEENDEQIGQNTTVPFETHNVSAGDVFSLNNSQSNIADSQPESLSQLHTKSDPFKVLSVPKRSPNSPRSARLSSESSELTEIAEAVLRQQRVEQNENDAIGQVASEQNRVVPIRNVSSDFNSPRFSPRTLEQKLMSELNYLESMQESMHQLTDAEKIYAVANVQQETVALSQILKARQLAHDNDLKELALKAKQETQEASRQLKEAQDKANHAALEAGIMQRQSEAELHLLARSEQLLESQQRAAQATSQVVQELTNLPSVARVVEGAEASKTPVTPVASNNRDRQNVFDGQSAQEIATTAAVAAARAVIAENIQKSMDKVASRRKHDSASPSYNRNRVGSRTSSESFSVTPSESLSPRSQSARKSPVSVQEMQTVNKVPSHDVSPTTSISSKRRSPVQRSEEKSRSQKSSSSEEILMSVGSLKASPSHQKSATIKTKNEDKDNFEDSRTIYTEKYSEIMSDAENEQSRISDKSNDRIESQVTENIDDESLHSIGSLQAVDPKQDTVVEKPASSAPIQAQEESVIQSIKSVASSSKKDSSSLPQNVNSLLSKSDSILSHYSPTASPRSSPKPASVGGAKSKSSGQADGSILTAVDYSDDFDATQDGKSKLASVSVDPDRKKTEDQQKLKEEVKHLEPKKLFSPQLSGEGKDLFEDTLDDGASGSIVIGDDFSEEMLKQYLREEERRAQHQAALIKLREKALKDKAKAEMEYLDQLKQQHKGDSEKMSTIKKRQRAVVIKLQEEQAELRRLEIANKAGTQQRQLLMVQQREISKMRESTLHLKSKIKQLEEGTTGGGAGLKTTPSLDSATDLDQLLKRSSTPTYLKSRKIKDLKAELAEEEKRLISLKKNTAAAAASEPSDNGASGKVVEGTRSDSSSVLEEIDRVESSLSYQSTSNRSVSDAEDLSHQKPTTASSIPTPRSLVGSKTSKLRVTPRHKSPALPSSYAASEIREKVRRNSNSSVSSYSDAYEDDHHSSSTANYSSDAGVGRGGRTSSFSDASDVEGRIQALKEDLRRRKEEAERLRQLKKGKRTRDREHARIQEENIRKQLKYYDEYIAKATAELEKADSENVLLGANDELVHISKKPVIRTPSARSSRSTTPVPSARNSESSTTELVHDPGSKLEPEVLGGLVFEEDQDYEEEVLKTPENEPEKKVALEPELHIAESRTIEKLIEDEVLKSLSPRSENEVQEELSVAEEIDNESDDSTLEDEISISAAKEPVDSDVALTPRASTPVSKESSGQKSPADKTRSLEPDNEPVLSPAADATITHSSEAESSKDGSVPKKDNHLSEFSKSKDEDFKELDISDEKFTTISDPLEEIGLRSKVVVDDKKSGVLMFKSQVKDKFLIGVELDDSLESHDSRCDEFFSCKHGPGMLVSQSDRVKAAVDKNDTGVEPELIELHEDYSLDFEDKTTGTAGTGDHGTPRILASAASIKEEIVSEIVSSTSESKQNEKEISAAEDQNQSSDEPVNITLTETQDSGKEEAEPNNIAVELEKTPSPEKVSEVDEEKLIQSEENDKSAQSERSNKVLESTPVEDLINESEGKEEELAPKEDDESDFESISFSIHDAETIGIATVYETVDTACDVITEPEACYVDDEPFVNDAIKKVEDFVEIEEPPLIEDAPLPPADLSDTDASEYCDRVFESIFDQVLDEVFEDRKLHLGFVNDYSHQLSSQFVEQALDDSFICRDTKRTKLRTVVYSKEVSEIPRVDSIEEESSETIDELEASAEDEQSPESVERSGGKLEAEQVDKLREESLEDRKLILDKVDDIKPVSAKKESVSLDRVEPRPESPVSEEVTDKSNSENILPASPSSPTAGIGGEFIDDDLAFNDNNVATSDESKENIAPIVPPIDISEITSEPDKTQKPTLPDSGLSVEETALSARLSAHAERIASIFEPQMFVPCKSDEIKELSNSYCAYFFNQRSLGEDFNDSKIPIELLGSDSVGGDDVSKSRKSFKVMMFELVREIVADIYQTVPKVTQPWMKPKMAKRVHYQGMRPKSIEMLNDIVDKKVLNMINLSSRQQHRTQTLKFGHKRRDLVDKILIQELREEESQWVDYNDDELNVKVQLTDAIFDSLVDDALQVLTKIQQKHESSD